MAVQDRTRRRCAITASFLLASVPAGVALAGDVGIAAAVVNDVKLRAQGAAQPHAAREREHIALAEQVNTGAASRLQILLLDRSTFTVGANARLVIDRFVYDLDRKSNFTATVVKGAFRFMSGSNGHGASSSIKTPVASIGIRGTIVDGIVGAEAIAIARHEAGAGRVTNADPETATLIALRGPGANASGKVTPGVISVEAGGKTVEANRPMQAIFVPYPGAQPIGPFTLSLPGLQQLDMLILPATNPVLTEGPAPDFAPSRPRRPFYPGIRGTLGGPPEPGGSVPNAIPGPGMFNGLPQPGTNNPAGPNTPPANPPTRGTGNALAPAPTTTRQPVTNTPAVGATPAGANTPPANPPTGGTANAAPAPAPTTTRQPATNPPAVGTAPAGTNTPIPGKIGP